MKILIGYSRCQFTREAFASLGIDAYTCDILPVEGDNSKHLQGDIWEFAEMDWDAGIFHPMCTYLTVSAAWAFKG